MPFFDTHAHLFDNRFTADLPATMDRATTAGVEGVIAVGIDRESSRASVEIAQRFPFVNAAVGIQPNSVAEAAPGDWDAILAMVNEPRVVAVGETGLDRYWDRAPFPLQEDYFARHIALSRSTGKPLVIHCREAEADIVRMMKEDFEKHGPVRGVMHSFTGDAATMAECVALGLFVSFAGMVTYKNAEVLRAVARDVPADRLLIETDCPYLAPVPHRGQRNEPAHVLHTAACLATVRDVSMQEIGAVTTANAQKLFG